MLDLTGLENLSSLEGGSTPTGTPLLVALDDIIRDPKQPRKQFDQEPLQELSENIKDRGVKSPISLKSKNADGKYIINHGERRWLASRLAGKTHIPAFIEDDHDGFDQVAENVLRDNLKPVELADWIQARIDEGMKQADIGRKLRKGKDWVSRHVKIAAAPKEIRAVADRCADYTALYELASAYENYPEQTLELIAASEQISRKDIAQLVARCKNPLSVAAEMQPAAPSAPAVASSAAGNSDIEKQGDEGAAGTGEVGSAAGNAGETDGGSDSEKPKDSATEKNTTANKAQPKDQSEAAQSSGTVSLLQQIYAAQVKGGQDADTVIGNFADEDWLKVCRQLTKEHEKGQEIDLQAFAGTLLKGLQANVYASTGEGMYRMLAFIQGALFKDEKLDPETMRDRCFRLVDGLH